METTKHHLHGQVELFVEVVGQGQADPVDALGGVQLQQRLARLYVPHILPLLDLQANVDLSIVRSSSPKDCSISHVSL